MSYKKLVLISIVLFLANAASAAPAIIQAKTSACLDALVLASLLNSGDLPLQQSKTDLLSVTSESFCAAVAGGVTVTSEESTILNGVEVDAVNTPTLKKIVVSQRRNRGKDFRALKLLAVHEYLAVLGVDDSAFKISGPIAAKLSDESDFFPVRYCETKSILQVGSVVASRLQERSYLEVTLRTDFLNSTEQSFWFDFSAPLRFVRDKSTGRAIEVLQWVATLTPTEQKCTELQDGYGRDVGSICVTYKGNSDLLTEYILNLQNPRTRPCPTFS